MVRAHTRGLQKKGLIGALENIYAELPNNFMQGKICIDHILVCPDLI